jgi:hypothetical protein
MCSGFRTTAKVPQYHDPSTVSFKRTHEAEGRTSLRERKNKKTKPKAF